MSLACAACSTSSEDERGDAGGTGTHGSEGSTSSAEEPESSSDGAEASAESDSGFENVCSEHAEGEADLETMLACDLPELCSHSISTWAFWCYEGIGDERAHEENATCLLEALRDATPGHIMGKNTCWGWEDQRDIHHLFSGGDRMVTRVRALAGNPEYFCTRSAERCALAPESYFEACLETTDEHERFECLRAENWVESCEPADAGC